MLWTKTRNWEKNFQRKMQTCLSMKRSGEAKAILQTKNNVKIKMETGLKKVYKILNWQQKGRFYWILFNQILEIEICDHLIKNTSKAHWKFVKINVRSTVFKDLPELLKAQIMQSHDNAKYLKSCTNFVVMKVKQKSLQ